MSMSEDRTPQEIQSFNEAMAPRWSQIDLLLAADRPPDWKGYKIVAKINLVAGDQFNIDCGFRDCASNRTRLAPKAVYDSIASLHSAYIDFSHLMQFTSVTLQRTWDPAKKCWHCETSWEYLLS